MSIQNLTSLWRLSGGGLELDIDSKTGALARLAVAGDNVYEWSRHPGDVTVRDDRLLKCFTRDDLQTVCFNRDGGVLEVEKTFRGAPWRLVETYRVEADAIRWEAEVRLDAGEFRSCAVSYRIPWPQPQDYGMKMWAAREHMPSAPHRFAEIALEYGESTSGIMIPAVCCYREDKGAGLLLAMPFDFRTPRLRFISSYREPELQAEFDWLALAPGKPARTCLLMRGTGGNWRPALGWLYERFREYFEPRSPRIHDLWGGHVAGGCDVSLKAARAMVDLGLAWHEVHLHFPAYGNYHPEGVESWRSGHSKDDPTAITVAMIRRTIANLQKAGAAALPYIQVSGDGDLELLPAEFDGSRIRDLRGNEVVAWPGSSIMNSDPSLPFGRDISRQIDGMVARYPEMDGVFLDQPCYNFLDTAHHDGLTAVDNRPCYMTGLNYHPHLEHLSRLLHPDKVIIGNAPFCVSLLKYIDAFMAEGSGWLCDHLQYYSLAKPMFFLLYEVGDRDIELMFQRCIVHAAGYTSYANASRSKNLYTKYRPLGERLFRRRWVFDPDPLKLPSGFEGNLYRAPAGSLLAGMASVEPRLGGRSLRAETVCVKTADTPQVRRVTLQQPGGEPEQIPFTIDADAVQFDIPGRTVAAVAELEFRA